MAQTTKRIRQRIEQKRNQQRQRQNRRKLGLISLFAGMVLLVLPALIYGVFAWFTLNATVQVIPAYEVAVENFISAARNQSSPQFLARNTTGETMPLFQYGEHNDKNNESTTGHRWVRSDELNVQTLNGIYALYPSLFIESAQTDSPASVFTFLGPLQGKASSPTNSPLIPIAQLLLQQAGRSGTQLEVQLVTNELQTAWTAEELATWLLNSSYFGNQQFGLDAAAAFYYDRETPQLTLPEVAMLLGTLDNPSINPVDNPAGAKLRQEAVLEAMLRQNFITQEQFIAARFTPLDVTVASFQSQDNLILRRLLHSQLEGVFTADEIANRPLNIVTAIDPELQRTTECLSQYYHNYLGGLGLTGERDCPEAVRFATQDNFPSGNFRPVDSILVTIIHPKSGEILALSGAGEIADLPLGPPQNPGGALNLGGAFYPFIYASALSQGHALSSMVLDIGEDANGNLAGLGPIFLEEALRSGSAFSAADVLEWVGQNTIFTIASEMGMTSLQRTGTVYTPLSGSADVQAGFLDVAQAYAVLANSGIQPNSQVRHPIAIQQIENERGDILFEQIEGADRPILPNEIVWLINQAILDEPLENGQNVAFVQPYLFSTATGTNPNGEWAIGYSPDHLVAVWAGSTQPTSLTQPNTQSVTRPLWEHLMSLSTQSTPVATWPIPANVVRLNVCWPSGLQPNGLCPTREGLFASGTEPVQFDTMFRTFLINGQTGNLATSSTPANLIEEVTYQVFTEEAQAWAAANGYESPPAAYDPITIDARGQGFAVSRPAPFDTVDSASTIQLNLDQAAEFDSFRVAFYVGLSPGRIEVIANGISPAQNRQNLSVPVQLPSHADGLITLLITGFRPDGSIAELALPVTVE